MRDNSGQAACSRFLVSSSPHGRESKTVLDSGFHAVDSGSKDRILERLCQWKLGFRIQIVSGIPDSLSSISDCTSTNFPDFKFSLHGAINSSGKRRNRLTQLKPIVQVQPPNGQLSQFCIRRPLKSSPSGGVWCTFCPLFLKFDTRTKLH